MSKALRFTVLARLCFRGGIMSAIRRFIGIIIVLIALSAIVVSAIGIWFGRQGIDQLGASVDGSFQQINASLVIVEDTLDFAKVSVGDVSSTLDTVVVSVVDASTILSDTQPLLSDVTLIASENVPDSLQALEDTIPTLVSVAEDVDNALTILSDLDLNINAPAFEIPAIPFVRFEGISFSGINVDFAGIDYDPPVPLAESIASVGGTLEGVPENLRSLSAGLDVANQNLGVISQNILAISTDLVAINDRIQEIPSLLDQYIAQVQALAQGLISLENSLPQQLETLKLALTILLVWFALTQLAPLYIGWTLITDKLGNLDEKMADVVDERVAETLEEKVAEAIEEANDNRDEATAA
jgi:hypothetical protein